MVPRAMSPESPPFPHHLPAIDGSVTPTANTKSATTATFTTPRPAPLPLRLSSYGLTTALPPSPFVCLTTA